MNLTLTAWRCCSKAQATAAWMHRGRQATAQSLLGLGRKGRCRELAGRQGAAEDTAAQGKWEPSGRTKVRVALPPCLTALNRWLCSHLLT